MDYRKEAIIRRELVGFEPFPKDEKKEILKDLTKEDIEEYYRKERLYNYVNNYLLVGLEERREKYSLIKNALRLNRVFIDHQRYKIIADKSIIGDRSVIYALTHIGLPDYQVMTEILNNHTYALAGDPEVMYGTFDGAFMEKSGVIWCDTDDELDRYISEKTAIRIVNNGTSIYVNPEGVWNLTPNLLVLPIWPGVIRIAQSTHADIIPVAVEQYGHKFIIYIGENIHLTNYDTKDLEYIDEKRQELRDALAKGKFEVIASRRPIKRKRIGDYETYANNFRQKRYNEWLDKDKKPIYNDELVKHRTYKEKNQELCKQYARNVYYSSPEDAFAYLRNIPYNEKTCFMLASMLNDASIPNNIKNVLRENIKNTIEQSAGGKKSFEEIKRLILN